MTGTFAGADSITDMGLLRHGRMGRLYTGVRVPPTLGTSLRSYRLGHVRQLAAVAAWFTAGLAQHAPIISRSEPVTYLDTDDMIRATFGIASVPQTPDRRGERVHCWDGTHQQRTPDNIAPRLPS